MADNNQNNDEYKFTELDSSEPNEMGELDYQSEKQSPPYADSRMPQGKNIQRNALITIGIVLFIMVLYKLVGYVFFSDTKIAVNTKPAITPIETSSPQPAMVAITPAPVQTTEVHVDNSALTQKVSAIETAQDSVRSEVSSMNQQVGIVNDNVNNLNNQIKNLNQTITNLSTQMANQSQEINLLMERSKPKKIVRPIPKPPTEHISYYIKAVIPGRAWIIGTNGSTLTVREGTRIAGYGIVRLIDSLQGRVITSSGQVIKFSQEDS